jgi:hypothetical protein
LRLFDEVGVSGVAGGLGVAEDYGVLAHQVVHGVAAVRERDLVLDQGVQAEECFVAVEQIQLEQRGDLVGTDLGACFPDAA